MLKYLHIKKVIQLILIKQKQKLKLILIKQNLILIKQKSSIYDIAVYKRGRKCTIDEKGLINPALPVIHSL